MVRVLSVQVQTQKRSISCSSGVRLEIWTHGSAQKAEQRPFVTEWKNGKGLGPDPEKTEGDHSRATIVHVAITQENLTGVEQEENSTVS